MTSEPTYTLIDILTRQKGEIEALERASLTTRYQAAKLSGELSSPLVKVIAGPRRAGKSTLVRMVLKEKSFAYANFDDELICQAGGEDLISALKAVYGETEFVFFDEIQNYPKWEVLVNKLHRRGTNLIITGSNSKLLSSELASSLTGRHVEIELLPFSFQEFCEATGSEPGWQSYQKYLELGGFPELVAGRVKPGSSYAGALFDQIVLRDMVRRYKVRQTNYLTSVLSLLINNVACRFSARSLAKALGGQPSAVTVEKYLKMAEEAYLLESLEQYSAKTKARLSSDRKIFATDSGFIEAKSQPVLPNLNRLLENSVYLELRRRGYVANHALFYYQSKSKREVDFITRRGHQTLELIQVSLDIAALETRERETKGLLAAQEELKGTRLLVLTANESGVITEEGQRIELMPVWSWACSDQT